VTFDDLKLKYFLSESNESECAMWLQIALKEAASFMRNADNHKIHSDITLPELEKLFNDPNPPEMGQSLSEVFRESVDKVMRHSVRVASPDFIGHMTGVTPYFSLICDLLICALNQNVVKIETALSASFVEGQTLAWLHRMVYGFAKEFYEANLHSPSTALGNVTNGGTVGNITALTVARNLKFPLARRKGIAAAMSKAGANGIAILVSKRGHYSVKKAAQVLGIGEDNVMDIPVHPFSNKIDLTALKNKIKDLQSEQTAILAIIGVAGSTETGSIDDLQQMAAIARENRIWFHVDAAWGGPLLLSQTHRNLLQGIECADSVVLDGHKLFYIPMSHGTVLFKDPRALDSLRHTARYIIRSGSVDLGRTTLEGSRRFDSFKMWFFLKVLGKNGFNDLLNHATNLAARFGQLVQHHDSFQLTSCVETNILTYRYVPAAWKQKLEAIRLQSVQKVSAKEHAAYLFANAFLNEINVDVQKKQRQAGKSFVSRTTLESVTPGIEAVVLRAVLFHPNTECSNLEAILQEQLTLGTLATQKRWRRWRSDTPDAFEEFFPSL
jgi:putative pyridoxal-dependent aspartate 1-decarboxylase